MDTLKIIITEVFEYYTPKIVHIKNRKIGLFNRLVQFGIILYIIGYVIIYKKGYQDFSTLESAVTTKVKGVVFTNFSKNKFVPSVRKHEDMYNRIWDVVDYVVPPTDDNSFFVTTNILISANQTRSTCGEDPNVAGARCNVTSNHCKKGMSMTSGNGVMTGLCVPSGISNSSNYSCEILAWCPVERDDDGPLTGNKSLLIASKNFTVLIKNFVEFPKYQIRRRNILNSRDDRYLKTCRYDLIENSACPVFVLGDIVKQAQEDYDNIAVKGGVIAITIKWDCNFDFSEDYCLPTYSFRRLDIDNVILAPGLNFRYAHYYNDTWRTLFKAYGIKFVIIVTGQGGKFSIVPLFLNIGSGLGLLAVTTVLCDIVVLYLVKKRTYYRAVKYEDVEDAEAQDKNQS